MPDVRFRFYEELNDLLPPERRKRDFGVRCAVGATVGHAIVLLLLLIAAAVYPVLKWLNPHRALRGYLMKAIVALVGWIASNTHLRLFDPLYLARGRLRRLLRLQ